MNYKISLYANDVILFLQSAQISLSETITLIDKFLNISDYSIKLNKSTRLPINLEF